ncbi:DNA repair protein RadC [Maricaulis maris]|jgi:DNA repair protein RadC|uniref:DNA repair protein RadC n=1 Tax=Maricaulis maris (strain MCS10) TaxID=394221 RepID=Q0AQV1_MARMM|nr:DNA repair protein RadC [Maricaulis maris]ABI65336.1 DNA repair protein RadC [Maricaulis maris MCS10]
MTASATHTGHRDRLREKLTSAGGLALHDYELLELYLFRCIPRRDVKPIAKDLIARFGDLGGVASASVGQLSSVRGVSEKTAVELKLIKALSERLAREQVIGRRVITSWSALVAYCRTAMQHATTEQFRVLFLDRKNKLIADEVLGEGTIDHAPVYPREVVKSALAHEASAIILVHNHPSGDATPSQADIEMTRTLMEICKPFEIAVHDHLVIGRENTASFKTLGLM